MTVLGQQVPVRNYICSRDGIHYRPAPENANIRLVLLPTNECGACCPFCIAAGTAVPGRMDLSKLERVLTALKAENALNGITITGGEPFTDAGYLDELLCMIYGIMGTRFEVSVTTNGMYLNELHRIRYLSYLDQLHISRHHYRDDINNRLFGREMPTGDRMRELLTEFAYKDLFVFNCVLLKEGIANADEACRYMDFAIRTGAGKTAFQVCSDINAYCGRQRISYAEVLPEDDRRFLFTRSFCDRDACRCSDGIYFSAAEGGIMEFYGHERTGNDDGICRALIMRPDNKLLAGYDGTVLWEG
ncbi:MAG: radical SAM protein [Clostridia bacterium]|nr:radical SAM protein [Clostridia bacterium]